MQHIPTRSVTRHAPLPARAADPYCSVGLFSLPRQHHFEIVLMTPILLGTGLQQELGEPGGFLLGHFNCGTRTPSSKFALGPIDHRLRSNRLRGLLRSAVAAAERTGEHIAST